MLPSDVSAVIVTRGNTDLTPVLESLEQFDEIVVWDNSVEQNAMTYGRVLALERCRNNVVWSQDDDIVHTEDNQRLILGEYRPGVLTGCMWEEWSNGALAQGIEGGYSDLVFPGSGSVYDKQVAFDATTRYLNEWPLDDFFMLWCDTLVGILAPNRQLNIEFDALPEAEDDYRMCYLPNAVALKTEAIRRARQIRDRKPSWRDTRVHAAAERVA